MGGGVKVLSAFIKTQQIRHKDKMKIEVGNRKFIISLAILAIYLVVILVLVFMYYMKNPVINIQDIASLFVPLGTGTALVVAPFFGANAVEYMKKKEQQ